MTRIWLVEGKGKPRAHVAARLSVQGPAMLPHDDQRLQLEAVNAWGRHNHGLQPRVDRGAQEDQEYKGGKRRYRVRL
jgi:hypothetical protein